MDPHAELSQNYADSRLLVLVDSEELVSRGGDLRGLGDVEIVPERPQQAKVVIIIAEIPLNPKFHDMMGEDDRDTN